MEFTHSPSSIFQNKKIKYNNKKPTKNGIIWINFSNLTRVGQHSICGSSLAGSHSYYATIIKMIKYGCLPAGRQVAEHRIY